MTSPSAPLTESKVEFTIRSIENDIKKFDLICPKCKIKGAGETHFKFLSVLKVQCGNLECKEICIGVLKDPNGGKTALFLAEALMRLSPDDRKTVALEPCPRKKFVLIKGFMGHDRVVEILKELQELPPQPPAQPTSHITQPPAQPPRRSPPPPQQSTPEPSPPQPPQPPQPPPSKPSPSNLINATLCLLTQDERCSVRSKRNLTEKTIALYDILEKKRNLQRVQQKDEMSCNKCQGSSFKILGKTQEIACATCTNIMGSFQPEVEVTGESAPSTSHMGATASWEHRDKRLRTTAELID